MPFGRILQLLARAMIWAPLAAACFLLLRLLYCRFRKQAFRWRLAVWSAAGVFYLTVLLMITVFRPDMNWRAMFDTGVRGRYGIQLIPFIVTVKQLRGGWLRLFYPVAGNILWFMPLGVIHPARAAAKKGDKPGWVGVFLLSLLLSLAIEGLQWLWGTGVSDIDDVIFNVAGGLAGYGLYLLFRRIADRGKI